MGRPAPWPIGGGWGITEALIAQIAEMRAALAARRGSWAVLSTFEKPNHASSYANGITKRRPNDSRLTGIEVAGRKMLDGGSKLYVRAAPA